MTQPQAIVIGGSIAGLLASRVLSDFYDRVIILDRDRLPVTPQPRRGVSCLSCEPITNNQ